MAGHIRRCQRPVADLFHHTHRNSRPHSAVRSRRWFAQRRATRRPRSRRPVPAQAPTALRPPLMQDKAVQIEASVSSVAVARCPEPLFRERRRPPRWLPRFPRSARRQRLAGFEGRKPIRLDAVSYTVFGAEPRKVQLQRHKLAVRPNTARAGSSPIQGASDTAQHLRNNCSPVSLKAKRPANGEVKL